MLAELLFLFGDHLVRDRLRYRKLLDARCAASRLPVGWRPAAPTLVCPARSWQPPRGCPCSDGLPRRRARRQPQQRCYIQRQPLGQLRTGVSRTKARCARSTSPPGRCSWTCVGGGFGIGILVPPQRRLVYSASRGRSSRSDLTGGRHSLVARNGRDFASRSRSEEGHSPGRYLRFIFRDSLASRQIIPQASLEGQRQPRPCLVMNPSPEFV